MPALSIYYTARRSTPLTNEERLAIRRVEAAYSVEERMQERERTRRGPNWEDFCIYDPDDPTEPDVIFEGATRLPDNSWRAVFVGLEHWCLALSEVRKALPNAEWYVAVNEMELPWDVARERWVPWEQPRTPIGWLSMLLARWPSPR